MKTLNFVKILLFSVIAVSLASCGDDIYYTMQNSDNKLCGKKWMEQYWNEDGELCEYMLEFEKEKRNNRELLSGTETTITYKKGGTNTVQKDFTWEWMDSSMEGLILYFKAGDVSYFENVWVREHYLSGKLDGIVVVLTDLAME